MSLRSMTNLHGRFAAVLVVLMVLLAACGGTTAQPTATSAPQPTPTVADVPQLRVLNDGPVTIDTVSVRYPEDKVTFENVAAGQPSPYMPVARGVYGYAALELVVDGQILSYPVIDWMGASPLGPGSYTLKLKLDLENANQFERVKMEVVRD